MQKVVIYSAADFFNTCTYIIWQCNFAFQFWGKKKEEDMEKQKIERKKNLVI